jgi:hypothetical protein
MTTMLVPGHDRDALTPDTLEAIADTLLAIDEYAPLPGEERTLRIFLDLTNDDVFLHDARQALDELSYAEWRSAMLDTGYRSVQSADEEWFIADGLIETA